MHQQRTVYRRAVRQHHPEFGGLCLPVPRLGQFAYSGFEEFPNTGGRATISNVKLVHPRHLRLVAAWVLPISDPSQRIGLGAGFPTASRLKAHAAGAHESAGTRYLLHFPYGFSVRVGRTC